MGSQAGGQAVGVKTESIASARRNSQLLLLHSHRSQLRWTERLVRTSPWRFGLGPRGRRPRGGLSGSTRPSRVCLRIPPQRQVSGLHWMLTPRPGRRAEKQPDDDDDDENLTVSVSVAQLF